MEKIHITDRQAFIEWKKNYTTKDGKFYAECYNEEEPKSYPCILLKIDDYNYNSKLVDYDIFYDFVYFANLNSVEFCFFAVNGNFYLFCEGLFFYIYILSAF